MVKGQAGVPGFNTYMYMYLHMQCCIARLFLLVVHGGLFMSSLAGRTLSMIPPQGQDFLLLKATYAVLKSSPWCISSTSVGYTQRLAKINRSFNFSIFTGLL